MIPKGIAAYARHGVFPHIVQESKVMAQETSKLPDEEILVINEEDLDGIYIKSLGVELLQEIGPEKIKPEVPIAESRNHHREFNQHNPPSFGGNETGGEWKSEFHFPKLDLQIQESENFIQNPSFRVVGI